MTVADNITITTSTASTTTIATNFSNTLISTINSHDRQSTYTYTRNENIGNNSDYNYNDNCLSCE